MTVRPLKRSDYEMWLPLWNANCAGKISADTTTETWRRLANPKEMVHGLAVYDEADEIQGFLHYILHHTTGHIEPACYMQDLYITESSRRQGLAKRLIWELHSMGNAQKWARIYWFAENDNIATQNLYKTLGIRMDFSLHILQTK